MEKMEKIDIRAIFEKAQKDPSLYSTLDIVKLLNSVENEKNNYLENQTAKTITRDIFESLNGLPCSSQEKQEFLDKLTEYRYIDEIREIHLGKYIRWIRKETKTPPKLTNGGLVVNIKFAESGIIIVCKNSGNHFTQFKFDDCLCYQKMSTDELMLLMAYENIEKPAI